MGIKYDHYQTKLKNTLTQNTIKSNPWILQTAKYNIDKSKNNYLVWSWTVKVRLEIISKAQQYELSL